MAQYKQSCNQEAEAKMLPEERLEEYNQIQTHISPGYPSPAQVTTQKILT